MLYNPEWTKADPLTLPALIAWLEKQPANATYCYYDHGLCLAAQYCQHIGVKYATPNAAWERAAGRSDVFPVVMENIACIAPWTFGAALARAKALLP